MYQKGWSENRLHHVYIDKYVHIYYAYVCIYIYIHTYIYMVPPQTSTIFWVKFRHSSEWAPHSYNELDQWRDNTLYSLVLKVNFFQVLLPIFAHVICLQEENWDWRLERMCHLFERKRSLSMVVCMQCALHMNETSEQNRQHDFEEVKSLL